MSKTDCYKKYSPKYKNKKVLSESHQTKKESDAPPPKGAQSDKTQKRTDADKHCDPEMGNIETKLFPINMLVY